MNASSSSRSSETTMQAPATSPKSFKAVTAAARALKIVLLPVTAQNRVAKRWESIGAVVGATQPSNSSRSLETISDFGPPVARKIATASPRRTKMRLTPCAAQYDFALAGRDPAELEAGAAAQGANPTRDRRGGGDGEKR